MPLMLPREEIRLQLQQRFEEMADSGDYFLNIYAETQEYKDLIDEVLASLDSVVSKRITRGKEVIVKEDLGQPISAVSMNEAQQQMLFKMHNEFLAWTNAQYAQENGLPMYTVQLEDGTAFNMLPLNLTLEEYKMIFAVSLHTKFLEDREKSLRNRGIIKLPHEM